jgi:hypothetical protein
MAEIKSQTPIELKEYWPPRNASGYMDEAMAQHVCEHLRAVEDYLAGLGHKITFAGQAWSSNCRHWVYFDTRLDCDELKRRFNLEPCVEVHANEDPRSGREKGLVCHACKDAVIGIHPDDAKGRPELS